VQAIDNNLIIQVAVVVEDIEEAAKVFSDIFKMDLPAIVDVHENKKEYVNYYKGKKTDSYSKTCYFPMGQLDLELIQPVGENIEQREFLNKKGPGLHHIAFKVKNIDKKIKILKSQGLEVVQKTNFPGGVAALLNIPNMGVNIELLEGADKPKISSTKNK